MLKFDNILNYLVIRRTFNVERRPKPVQLCLKIHLSRTGQRPIYVSNQRYTFNVLRYTSSVNSRVLSLIFSRNFLLGARKI